MAFLPAASVGLLGLVLLLPLGCGGVGPGEQPQRWSEPYVAMGPRALAARPTGETQETPVSLTRTAWDCEYDPFDDDQNCNQIYEDVRAEVVEYRCDGLDAEIEVVPGEAMFTYVLRTTSDEPGECDLTVVLREPGSGKTYEGQVPIAFADPVRLAVEHVVALDPGLYYPVLVGAAFRIEPSLYAATEFNGLSELSTSLMTWEISLEGDSFACGCAEALAPCRIVGAQPDTSILHHLDVHAIAPGTSTFTVRYGALERVVTLEAVEESDVVGMELYQPIGSLGLMDADEDPLQYCERVTAIEDTLPSGVRDAHLASVLVLADGRRAWGGAGAYGGGPQYLTVSKQPNHSCEGVPPEVGTWLNVYGGIAMETTISAAMGSATVEFPVTVLPAE